MSSNVNKQNILNYQSSKIIVVSRIYILEKKKNEVTKEVLIQFLVFIIENAQKEKKSNSFG